jgi:EmrB/QacA subfamily drug resistance transporter
MDHPLTTNAPAMPTLPSRLLWAILGVVIIADMLDLLDSTITFIAAPTIVKNLGGGEALIKWLGASYALAMGVLLVVGGRLGDKYGQRRLFLVGIAGFTLASAVCGLSINPAMLVGARLFQGAAGALLIPQGVAILTKTFPRELFGKAASAFGPALGIATILGPIVAGFLIDANIAGLGWRPMFLINIVLGGIGFVAAFWLLPRDHGNPQVVVDGLGSILLAGTMFSLLYGLIDGSTYGWTRFPLVLLGAGLVFLGLFAWRQRIARHPLIELTLFKNRGFTSGLTLGLAFFAAVSGLAYVVSLFLQVGLRLSPRGAALGLTPFAMGIVIASAVSVQLIARLGRTLIFLGLMVTLIGAGWLLFLVNRDGTQLQVWATVPAVLVIGYGMGTCFGTLFDVALGAISPQEAGSASGSLSAVQQLAAAIGSAAITSVYFHIVGGEDQARAMSVSLIVVMGIILFCCGLVWLLPRHAHPQHE